RRASAGQHAGGDLPARAGRLPDRDRGHRRHSRAESYPGARGQAAGPPEARAALAMPTVRLRSASEYPAAVRKMFDLSREWFNHDFKEPPAMSRVMAWDPGFGAPHGRAMKRAMGPGEFTRGEKEMVAAVVSGVNACEY